jgi:hypothetical protein
VYLFLKRLQRAGNPGAMVSESATLLRHVHVIIEVRYKEEAGRHGVGCISPRRSCPAPSTRKPDRVIMRDCACVSSAHVLSAT